MTVERVIGAYRLKQEAIVPTYSSNTAACFDIYSCLVENEAVTYYSNTNVKGTAYVKSGEITLYSGQRMLIPTGFVFNIPSGCSMRIHPRSGLSLKNGIVVANCEGVVDSDYTDQTYVMLMNISDEPYVLRHGMRIAQGEVYQDIRTLFTEIQRKPQPKGNRKGGFGSTGV